VTAALPFPIVAAAVAAFLAGHARLVENVDGEPMELIITIVIGAAMLYLAGLIAAAFAVPGRKPSDDMDYVAEIFS
jgi:hypothetical protein